MTWHDEETNVRVITGGDYVPWINDTPEQPQRDRTDAQKHTDHAIDQASIAQGNAITEARESLAWLTSVGADIPPRLRGVITVLEQLGTFIDDERKRRG